MGKNKIRQPKIQKKRSLFFNVGLLISLATVLVAFEWKTFEGIKFVLGDLNLVEIEEEIIPITIRKTPPPPPPVVEPMKKVEKPVVNQLVVKKKVTQTVKTRINFNVDDSLLSDIPEVEEYVDEKEIFLIVETMPEFPGGMAALNQYLSENIRYPQLAKENGIEGKVFLSFVVEKDGSITDIEVLRGIHGGKMCDDEAVRVVKAMSKWSPGKQRGKPVRYSFKLPVQFTLR